MSPKHLLIASPINQEPEILKEFALSLSNLELEGIQADFLFIDDNAKQESSSLLVEMSRHLKAAIILLEEKSTPYRNGSRHAWNESRVSKMASMRNTLLKEARDREYDALFMVDSDLLLHPKTLLHLVQQEKAIISEIYWTSWSPGSAPYPQVWICDNYTQYQANPHEVLNAQTIREKIQKFHAMLKLPGVYPVGGLGGCTLLGKEVLRSKVSYAKIPNLSFLGEDRHFCVRAAVEGFQLFVDTHYPAYHLYRISDLKGAMGFKAASGYGIITPGF